MGILWLAKQQQQQGWLRPLLSQHLLLPSSCCRLLAGLRPFSNATPSCRLPPAGEPTHFMVEYLVDSCGLSRTDAVKASEQIVHLKSPEKPDAVLRLLKETGLCVTHISRLVRCFPKVLLADAKKTLEPKIRALQEVGFSNPELARLISVNPSVIRRRDAASQLGFWRKLLGNNKSFLRIAMNTHLLSCTAGGMANPSLSFLRSLGMSDGHIARAFVSSPRLVSTKLNKITSMVERVKSLGIAPGSGMFGAVLSTVCSVSQTTLEAKSKLMRSFGWSEDEILYVLHKFPGVFRLSEKKISRAMDFLLNEAGCRPSYVARRPALVSYSIDKRLIPRYYALQFLKKRGLPGGDSDLYWAMTMPQGKFVEKYIAPASYYVPEMLAIYPVVSSMRIAM